MVFHRKNIAISWLEIVVWRNSIVVMWKRIALIRDFNGFLGLDFAELWVGIAICDMEQLCQ
jgi:hypothetical protein